MSLASFKDLCIDASDAVDLGRFWAAALGLDFNRCDDHDARLTGPTPAHTIWVNQVPEPKTAKHRVHLDVHGSSIEEVEALGASVIDAETFPWIVMADPEGGEFCLFVRDDPPRYRLYELAVDCTDHEGLSQWWTDVIGGSRQIHPEGFSSIERIPGLPFDGITFASVEEGKAAKNRVHIDLVAPGIDPLLAAGATLLRRNDEAIAWDVLADPEGNEFCVFPSS